MKLPVYKVGDNITFRRKYTGEMGSGTIRFAYSTESSGPHYKLENHIPMVMEHEIISTALTAEEPEVFEENTKPTPPYLHITKKSLNNSDEDTYPYSYSHLPGSFKPYARNPSHDHWDKHVLSNTGPKTYKIPVHYMVTTYVHVVAYTQSEAIQKAQHVEAPQLEMWDSAAYDTTIESEVCPYDLEEIED